MKILFLNGSASDSAINSYIRSVMDSLAADGHRAQELVLRDMQYAPCRGCFNCWVKTPGLCVFKDDGDTICREFITSDMVVLASPIIMGYPSALAKNALDRIIPLLHPSLRTSAVRYTT
jgi:multimeric flavodoxin WrbA